MITLYSTHCPRCVVLEAKLKQQGVDFVLNENEEEMRQKGFLSAPMLEVNGNVMDFKKAVEWVNGVTVGDNNVCESCNVG